MRRVGLIPKEVREDRTVPEFTGVITAPEKVLTSAEKAAATKARKAAEKAELIGKEVENV